MGDAITSPPLAGPTPRMIPVDPISLCRTSLLCCILLWSVTLTVFQCISWTALLSETQRYFGPWYRDTPDWGSYWVWSRPMWDAITSPPIGWSHTRSDPCWPCITVQKLHCRVAYYCVQWPLLCCNVWAEPLYCRSVRNTALLWALVWGHPELGIILGVVSASGGRHHVASHWLVPHPEWSLSTLYHCAETSLLCCILLWLFSMTFTVFQFVTWTALLYICQKHRVILDRGIRTPRLRDHNWFGLGQWGTPLRHPPLAGPALRMIPVDPIYHCGKTSLLCCILLCSVTFTVFQCVSRTALL